MSGEAPAADASKKLLSHSYSIAYTLGNERTMQVNGSFFVDDDVPTMNKRLDDIIQVMDRQRAKFEVEALCAALEQMHNNLSRATDSLERLNAEVTEKGRSTTQLDAQIANTKADILRIQLDIVKGEKAIEEMRKKAA